MKRIVYNVLPAGDQWALSRRDGQPLGENLPRVLYDAHKYAVVRKGKDLARNNRPSQLVIHGADGKFQTEHTYGADPRRFKG